MLVRILVLVRSSPLRRRLERLAALPRVLVSSVSSRGSFWKHLPGQNCDMILVSRESLGEPPHAQIHALRALPDAPEVVVISPHGDPEERASLLAAGCLAMIGETISDAALVDTLTALVDRRRESLLSALRHTQSAQRYRLSDFATASPAMQALMSTVHRVVPSDSSLLILGETGVGKEWLARAIHEEGPRAAGPFLPVNCGSLTESLLESELFGHEQGAFTGAIRAHRGFFELAHGGTIFLDEVGDMPQHLQVKLLRVLQERRIQRVGAERSLEVDVRVVAATNRDLAVDVAAKRFRADLYYRLSVITLTVPPLRERREDIPALLDSYLAHFRARMNREINGFSDAARAALTSYDWPGNVRELVNVLERAVLLCSGNEIGLSEIPGSINVSTSAAGSRASADDSSQRDTPFSSELLVKPLREARHELLAAFERWYLAHWLRTTGGRVDATARRAGIDPRSLYEKMRAQGLRKEDFRALE